MVREEIVVAEVALEEEDLGVLEEIEAGDQAEGVTEAADPGAVRVGEEIEVGDALLHAYAHDVIHFSLLLTRYLTSGGGGNRGGGSGSGSGGGGNRGK